MPLVDNANQFARRRIRLPLMAIALVAGIAAPLAAAPPVLEPEWKWEPARGVEWVETTLGNSALLADTRDGKLHLLSLDSGQDLLAEPIPARPGLRPVSSAAVNSHSWRAASLVPQDAESMAYCFDRFTVLAIRLTPQPGLAWRVGTWCEGLAEPTPPGASPEKTFQGDPEQLRQLLAAGATPWGVIVVRDDGHFGLLDRNDGHVVWRRCVSPMAMARLHVRGDQAALIWRTGPEVEAAALDVRTATLREYPLLPERPWPFWSGLTGGGLVLIEPERCIITTTRSAEAVFRAPTGTNIISASVALRPESGPTTNSPAAGLLVFGTSDGVLHGIDARSGAERWAVPDLASPNQPWTWVKLLGDVVVSAAGGSAHVRAAETGQLLAQFDDGRGARLLDASVIGERVWVLIDATASGGAHFELAAIGWPTATAPTSTEVPARFDLGRAGVFLDGIWSGARLVVSTRTGVTTYAVPRLKKWGNSGSDGS
jgi:outer membrane protein assembly factor BamB